MIHRRKLYLAITLLFLVSVAIGWAALAGPSTQQDDTFFLLAGQLNLNTASRKQLMQLPFIGPERANKIVRYRARKRFSSVRDLLLVDGIGTDLWRSVRHYVKVRGGSDLQLQPDHGIKAVPTQRLASFDGPVHALFNQTYLLALTAKMRAARHDILLCMYLFKTSNSAGNKANQLLQELVAAARRGVRVQVILEQNNRKDDFLNGYNQATARRLRKAGIEVNFDRKDIITHAKVFVIDKRYVFLGSHNLSHTALSKSNETSLFVDSVPLAKALREYLLGLLPAS